MNAMRETGTSGWSVHISSDALLRTLRLAAVAAGIGLVMSAGVARAQEDEEDDSTISEKIIGGIMHGLGGINMDNAGIDYRERSPLVVPPRTDLPPPAPDPASAANWPKDPDVQARQARAAERKKVGRPEEVLEAARPLTPAEMAPKRVKRASSSADVAQPGNQTNNPMLSPSQLGVEGGFSKLFGGNAAQTAPFKGEPTRDSLTQPPSGYQTPSPNYAYGTGPKEVMTNSANVNPMTGKY
jgi:hypothetical protein